MYEAFNLCPIYYFGSNFWVTKNNDSQYRHLYLMNILYILCKKCYACLCTRVRKCFKLINCQELHSEQVLIIYKIGNYQLIESPNIQIIVSDSTYLLQEMFYFYLPFECSRYILVKIGICIFLICLHWMHKPSL